MDLEISWGRGREGDNVRPSMSYLRLHFHFHPALSHQQRKARSQVPLAKRTRPRNPVLPIFPGQTFAFSLRIASGMELPLYATAPDTFSLWSRSGGEESWYARLELCRPLCRFWGENVWGKGAFLGGGGWDGVEGIGG